MSFQGDNLGEFVKVTTHITLSPPSSLKEMSPEGAFNAALYAIIIKLQRFFPQDAEEIYEEIISDPVLIDLLSRFPAETTLDQLTQRALELLELYLPSDLAGMGETLSEYIAALYWLRTSRAEELALAALDAALGKIPSTIQLGGIEVATPFRSDFQTFLESMETRHTELINWTRTLFGGSQNRESETVGEWLLGAAENVAELGWENIGKELFDIGLDISGLPDPETIRRAQYNLGVDQTQWNEFWVQFAETVLVPLYHITEIGRNFREALQGEDKWWALAGVAFGMAEASPLGTFLDITIAAWQYSTDVTNQTVGTNWLIPDGIKNWRDVSNMNSGFQAGVAIGKVGMSVSDLVVGLAFAAVGTPPGIISFDAVASEASVAEATAVVVIPLSEAQALGLIQGGYGAAYLAEMASDNGGEEPDESAEPSGKQQSASSRAEEFYRELVDSGAPDVITNNSERLSQLIPEEWGIGQSTQKGVGWRWSDPENPSGFGIRIDEGLPSSPQLSQRVDHVIVRYNGRVIGRDGNAIPGSIADYGLLAHIPLSDWLTWAAWYSP